MNGTDAPSAEEAPPPAEGQQAEGQQADQPEPPPKAPGTRYGELSPAGQWFWDGTGKPDDHWITNPDKALRQQAETPEVQAAPTPGTTIVSTTTIDALFTSVFGTRSADLSATPTYSWATGNTIIAQWPTVLSNNIINNSAIFCTFFARSMAPSSISQ